MISAIKQRIEALSWALRALLALVASAVSQEASAQLIELPPANPAASASPWGAPSLAPAPTFGTPAPAFNPYTNAPVAPLSPGVPLYGTPTGPPPATSLPYSYTPPVQAAAPSWVAPSAPAYAYDAPPGAPGFSSDSSPLGWQPGTYGFQQSDGGTTRFRQLLARMRVEHTLLLGDNTIDAFQLNRTEFASTFALPFAGSIETPLLVTPGFAFNWFDGPQGDPAAMPRGPDLPPRVYDAYLDFAFNPRWTQHLGAELGVRTGVYSDFRRFDGDSLRILGRALAVASVTPQFELLAGAVYLDRLRVKLLPAGGVRWRPTPAWDLYLVFPNPKIRRKSFTTGSTEWWCYLAGEYGGGSWTVDRPGLDDRVDYNDLRLVLGMEWQTTTQATGHLEIGYAFDREFQFDSGQPGVFETDDAVLFRAGIGF